MYNNASDRELLLKNVDRNQTKTEICLSAAGFLFMSFHVSLVFTF